MYKIEDGGAHRAGLHRRVGVAPSQAGQRDAQTALAFWFKVDGGDRRVPGGLGCRSHSRTPENVSASRPFRRLRRPPEGGAYGPLSAPLSSGAIAATRMGGRYCVGIFFANVDTRGTYVRRPHGPSSPRSTAIPSPFPAGPGHHRPPPLDVPHIYRRPPGAPRPHQGAPGGARAPTGHSRGVALPFVPPRISCADWWQSVVCSAHDRLASGPPGIPGELEWAG